MLILDSKVIHELDESGEKLVTLNDRRGWIDYTISLCSSIYKECISRYQRSSNPLRENARNLFPALSDGSYEVENQPWMKDHSSRLIVFIHGLNSSPLCWTKYIQELSPHDYFAPYVYKKGYCRVKEAAKPILEAVQTYANGHPDSQIILVGHSFGAKIAQHVETHLQAKDIRLISIVGPHFGSKLTNWLGGLSSWIGISKDQAEELQYNGAWVNKKLTKWQQGSQKIQRVFFASADDLRIFPHNTSFPRLSHSTYYLISGESHVTLIDAVKDRIMQSLSD